MWSVATEWQIYFIFPLLLLPIWRKWGNGAVIAVAFAVGLAPHYLFHGFADIAAPWYIGLFTLGLVGAIFSFSDCPIDIAVGKAIPWRVIGGLLFLAWLVCVGRHINLAHYRWIAETLIAGAMTCFMVNYARMLIGGNSSPFPMGPAPTFFKNCHHFRRVFL